DRVGRYGGEEFIALLPATDSAGASIFAEKVRAATAGLSIPHVTNGSNPDGAASRRAADATAASPLHITVSGGGAVATTISQQAEISALGSSLVQVADRCLYRAKES